MAKKMKESQCSSPWIRIRSNGEARLLLYFSRTDFEKSQFCKCVPGCGDFVRTPSLTCWTSMLFSSTAPGNCRSGDCRVLPELKTNL